MQTKYSWEDFLTSTEARKCESGLCSRSEGECDWNTSEGIKSSSQRYQGSLIRQLGSDHIESH